MKLNQDNQDNQDTQINQVENSESNLDEKFILVKFMNGDKMIVEKDDLIKFHGLKDLIQVLDAKILDMEEYPQGNRIFTKKIFSNMIRLAKAIKNLTEDQLNNLKNQGSLKQCDEFKFLEQELNQISKDHDDLMNLLVYVHFFDCKWIHIAILQQIADMIQNEQIEL